MAPLHRTGHLARQEGLQAPGTGAPPESAPFCLYSAGTWLPLPANADQPAQNLQQALPPLNQEACSDLAWWRHFVEHWNGVSLLQLSQALTASANVFIDDSGRISCGAVWGNLWLQGIWPPAWDNVVIMVKELVPVVLACALWGKHWAGQLVHFHVDNMSVVAALTKDSSKEPSGIVMHLLWCLSFIAAHFQFQYEVFHVPGTLNTLADDISRDHLHAFSSPQCPIPPTLWSLLVLEHLDWTSIRWTTLFAKFTRWV